MADVLGREIQRIEDPVHANVRGAALLAGLALDELRAGDLHGRAEVRAVHEPDPTVAAAYDDLYAAFVGFYKANRKLYAALNGGRG
jgi:xylulokinase